MCVCISCDCLVLTTVDWCHQKTKCYIVYFICIYIYCCKWRSKLSFRWYESESVCLSRLETKSWSLALHYNDQRVWKINVNFFRRRRSKKENIMCEKVAHYIGRFVSRAFKVRRLFGFVRSTCEPTCRLTLTHTLTHKLTFRWYGKVNENDGNGDGEARCYQQPNDGNIA